MTALGVEAKGGTAIAVFRFAAALAPMGEMIAAGGHGEVRPEAQLAAFRIGEDEGAGADVLARTFEKDIGGLKNVGRDMLEAGALENAHDAGILLLERAPLG
jgi:hypothetical protein